MILFISDLHLDSFRPGVAEAFQRFLQTRASQAEALYILGDLFELWIGDDDNDPFAAQITAALAALTRQGVELYFIHGNRDFLVGDGFARRSGATLLEQQQVVDLYGEPTLIMHGDTLCTNDEDYQRFRAQVRQPQWQREVLAKTLNERRVIAQHLREQSRAMNSRKPQDIMDVTEDEVIRVMQAHGVRRLVHGHTHRPARHAITINGQPAERVVLGDWDRDAWCLQVTADNIDLQQWAID